MATAHLVARSATFPTRISVNTIHRSDLAFALRKGVADFRSRPSHYALLALVYPVFGIALGLWTSGASAWPVLYPLVSGFALLGPVAALGFYEISRRRELGLASRWQDALDVRHSPALPSIVALAGILVGLFVLWLITAQLLVRLTIGDGAHDSYGTFIAEILTTPTGWTLLVLGNLAGLAFAVAAFSLSVVSLPMMLDRKVGLGTAVRTSLAAVRASPVVMGIWGLLVAGLLVLASLPLLVGLAVIVPVLGHSTWHLYRRIVPNSPGA